MNIDIYKLLSIGLEYLQSWIIHKVDFNLLSLIPLQLQAAQIHKRESLTMRWYSIILQHDSGKPNILRTQRRRLWFLFFIFSIHTNNQINFKRACRFR